MGSILVSWAEICTMYICFDLRNSQMYIMGFVLILKVQISIMKICFHLQISWTCIMGVYFYFGNSYCA